MTTEPPETISGTTTRPSTTDIPTERAQRDEYDYQVSARGDDGYDHYTTNSVSVAASRQQNSAHCPNRAPHTQSTRKSPPLARPNGKCTSQSRRKPGGDDPSQDQTPTPQQQTESQCQPASQKAPETLTVRAEERGYLSYGSPQEPEQQKLCSGRGGLHRRSSEQPPIMLAQRRAVKEENLMRNGRSERLETPGKKSGRKSRPPTKKEPPHEKKNPLPPRDPQDPPGKKN